MIELTLQTSGPHAGQPVRAVGVELEKARAALILVHGRGASAADMLPLVENLTAPGFIYLAPEASGDLWYPNHYDSPLASNEPWLSSALEGLAGLVDNLHIYGIPAERTVLVGFSQGACLCAEFVVRNARRYGGLGVLAGGLIGPRDTPRNYPGSLEHTHVYLGCSDPDPYFTPAWIHYSGDVFTRLGAAVETRLFPNLGHRISLEMLRAVRGMIDAIQFEETA